jgi:hypothetical protein
MWRNLQRHDGRNVAIEFRWANGDNSRLADLAADLVGVRWRSLSPRSARQRPRTTHLYATQCGARMQEVARIAPFADQPGLRAYQCRKCGRTSSVLEASDKLRARRHNRARFETIPAIRRLALERILPRRKV